jgi:hypothetical protein
MFQVPERYRLKIGAMKTTEQNGNNGVFMIPNRSKTSQTPLKVIASDGQDWEHVSVSLSTRCPTWDEMNKVKNLFWDETDAVMQLHPPISNYVNNHPYCLHLWRPTNQAIPLPPQILV